MKNLCQWLLTLTVAAAAINATRVLAADIAADPAPPTNRPSPELLRGRARALNPQEREQRLRELRTRLGPGGTNRSEVEKRREEWRQLPPAEREARIRELRERSLRNRPPGASSLSPAEREAKRKEISSRLNRQIQDLESRQTNRTLTPLELRRLDRFRQMSRRLDQGTALGLPSPSSSTPPK